MLAVCEAGTFGGKASRDPQTNLHLIVRIPTAWDQLCSTSMICKTETHAAQFPMSIVREQPENRLDSMVNSHRNTELARRHRENEPRTAHCSLDSQTLNAHKLHSPAHPSDALQQ